MNTLKMVKVSVDFMDYVVGLAFNTAGTKVVLIHKLKPEWQKGFLNGVGGKVEKLESVPHAMVREFEEEAGVKTRPGEWGHFATGTGARGSDGAYKRSDRVYYYRLFSDRVFHAAKTMEAEAISKLWVSNLVDYPIVLNLKWLIPLALTDRADVVVFPI